MDDTLEYVKPLVETVRMKSRVLGSTVYYDVIEPQRAREGRTRPVLFLLHGLYGSRTNWTENTKILEYAADKRLVIVCPDAGDNWYVDRSEEEGVSYERYILDDLIPDAESRFAAGGQRAKRAIAGISMGGYGAMKMAIRHPEVFCFAGSMSGAFHAAELGMGNEKSAAIPTIKGVFSNREVCERNDLFAITLKAANISPRPSIYFDCGKEDEFIEVNRRFDRLLTESEWRHEYTEHEGGHDWDYWDRNLKQLIDRVEEILG